MSEQIKLLHISDVHLGVEKYGNAGGVAGQTTRLDDFLRSFDQAVNAAIEQDCDLMVFAGDAFKTRDPNPTVQREFAIRIRRLYQAGIPSFLLVGNHDLPLATARAHTLEIYDTLGIPDVQVARRPGLHTMQTRKGPVQIVAIPWVTPVSLLNRDEQRSLSIEQTNAYLSNTIEGVVDEKAAQLDLTRPAILTMHGSVEGSTYSSEQDIMLGNDVIIRRTTVQNPAFSYAALGHIHKHQVVANDPPAVYSGSLERIDFGEEKEEKGYVIATLTRREAAEERQNQWQASYQFHPTNARRFLTLRVDGKVEQPTEAVLQEIKKQSASLLGAIVRVQIATDVQHAPALRETDIRRALYDAGANHVAAVAKEMDRGERLRTNNDQLVEQLSPHDALALYFKNRKLTPARTTTLLRHADDLIGVGTSATAAGEDVGDRDGSGE